MKKIMIIIAVGLLIAGAYLVSPAEGKGWFKKDKPAAGKKMMTMCPMHKRMCQKMMEKKMVALEDGSIVIMSAGKLYKYDKDLNFVKDVELTKIKDDAKAKMQEMQKQCAEMCKMKTKKEMPESGEE